jgi:hypothetical protein
MHVNCCSARVAAKAKGERICIWSAWTRSRPGWGKAIVTPPSLPPSRAKCDAAFPTQAFLECLGRGFIFFPVSTAEKIFQKAQALPEHAQDTLLHITEEMAQRYPATNSSPLSLREAAELRGKLAAWEEDWNAPGMEAYDRA